MFPSRILVLVSLMLAGPASGDPSVPLDDDPKVQRGEQRAAALAIHPDEDDPKLARGAAVAKSGKRNTHAVPRFKLAYRRLSAAGLEGPPIDFNIIELDYYPSSGIFRFGLDTELGLGSDPYSSWFFTAGAVLGVQYPWRVTPFIDARFVAGMLGGSYLGQTAVSWVYMGGIETGIEVYTFNRFYLTVAIGWAHPVFSGIDVEAVRANPLLAPKRKEFANDTFTFKVGIGL